MIRWTGPLLVALALLGPPAVAAQPRTVDGVAIDPDAELVVALADDTTNMDPRIGMGSIRSNYIRQVFESLVELYPEAKLAIVALSNKAAEGAQGGLRALAAKIVDELRPEPAVSPTPAGVPPPAR